MSDIVTVSIACANEAEAQSLTGLLITAHLAACVQSHEIRSTYRWKGEIDTTDEIMLIAKTLSDRLPMLEALVKAHHSYEVPEILATPVVWASEDYATWLREALET
ncbi:divalent-cation tolerance protein CutA [Asticcacaulis sp.]|uniref:divalent-cation tolerance protein CutA n=1 Tax=Asticcacaulis sp. TaxID=1872648 RepID=UPI002BEB04F6|nr:divalent-cation tolerance protein CutA [Asticcacaulis sp.]HTM80631.1 divalent-cation tolerance protein CutA [Asticcacaulis sp.]